MKSKLMLLGILVLVIVFMISSSLLTLNAATNPTITESITKDDWNYTSSTTNVNVKMVQNGSGNNMITYYVADIKLSGDSSILSAFAKNTYGKNITEPTSKIAANNNAVLAINGDYYGFRNDGIVIRNSQVYRNSPIRDCLAIYKNGLMESLNENNVNTNVLLSNGVQQVMSFGPILVKSGNVIKDFVNVPSDQGANYLLQAHPRSGLGMIEKNHFVFIVVDGRSNGYSKGMTLAEFANTFADLGCKEAYNLDGGLSATMYFNGRVVNKPGGKTTERAISDILYVK